MTFEKVLCSFCENSDDGIVFAVLTALTGQTAGYNIVEELQCSSDSLEPMFSISALASCDGCSAGL